MFLLNLAICFSAFKNNTFEQEKYVKPFPSASLFDGAKKKRVIVRNQMGNIMVNSYFFKQQKFSELKNKGGVTNGIKFTCMMDVKGEMKMRHFITKLKPEDAPTMLAKCQEAAAAVS